MTARAEQSITPRGWTTPIKASLTNSPCNNIDAKGRCSAPSGLKPGQVGICIEAFIAAKTFKVLGLGDNRGFSGDDQKLTAKFKTHIVLTPSADNKEAYAYQATQAGVSRVINPTLTGPPVIALQGTAVTSLNGGVSGGTGQATAPVDSAGVARLNVTTTAVNGVSALTGIDLGTIRTGINVEANLNKGTVAVDGGSQATTYPSMAIYSYAYVNGKLVTTEVWKQDEGSPDDLKEPMKPIPDQTEKKP